jgi:hypothetical protein
MQLSHVHEPLLTTREAAHYLRFRSSSGIRTAVARGELTPLGAGAKGSHLFTRGELDRFVSLRAARYARGRHGAPGDRRELLDEERNTDTLSGRAPNRWEHDLHSGEDHRSSDRQEEGGQQAPRRSERTGSGAEASRASRRGEGADRSERQGSRWGLREIVDRVQSTQAGRGHDEDVNGRAREPRVARAG